VTELLKDHIEKLKATLMILKPTGSSGFEGLLAVVLSEIGGVPYRLANSGSQYGIDGKVAFEGENIGFEAKRYDKAIPRTEVLSKIAEVSINSPKTDLWILGATTAVSSQLADDITKLGQKDGIAILILDWSDTNLPPLSVCLAMCAETVKEFYQSQNIESQTISDLTMALTVIKESLGYNSHAEKIRLNLNIPSLGWGIARRGNSKWLEDVFSDKAIARNRLGQPLAPYDKKSIEVLARDSFVDKCRLTLLDNTGKKLIVIKGDEGHGKSWLVAQCWSSFEERPLMVLIKPEEFNDAALPYDFKKILLSSLIKQTGDDLSELSLKRWGRRLELWKSSPSSGMLKIIVVIDGINQRPGTDWGRVIDGFCNELNKIDGKLLITTRTHYYNGRVKNRVTEPSFDLILPEWTEEERNIIFSKKGIKASEINPKVAASLRNPRLLGIALELLDSAEIRELEELSVSRLLFEHMRASERDAPTLQTVQEFALKLQKHAQEIIGRVESGVMDDLGVFNEELNFVIDGRFFIPVEGEPSCYEIRDEGITLALGLAVISHLTKASRNKHDLDAELTKILEPISALDQTAKVVLAAITIICIDDNYLPGIGLSLLGALAELQNLDETDFISFSSLVEKRLNIFMQSANRLSLSGGNQQNFDWIEAALLQASCEMNLWEEMKPEIKLWLRMYSLSPEIGMMKHSPRDPAEEIQAEREKKKKLLDEKLAALSESEIDLQSNLIETEGDLNRLSKLAITLIAGKPVAPFAKEIILWSFSKSLNSGLWAPRKELAFLTRFNCIDWQVMRDALLTASNVFDRDDISNTGKWAFVTILYATGATVDGSKARCLADSFRDNSGIKGWRLVEKYCEIDPCNPDSIDPTNVKETAKQYRNVQVEKVRQTMGYTSEDHFFISAGLGVARFEPEIAINKYRELANDVLNRVDFPLRQGLFELEKNTAILSREIAIASVEKYRNRTSSGIFNGLSDEKTWIAEYFLKISFPFLSGREQIDILLDDEESEHISLGLMDVSKPLKEDYFDFILERVYKENAEKKLFVLFGFASETHTPISEGAQITIGKLLGDCSKRVQSQLLALICKIKNEELIKQVALSQWAVFCDDSKKEWGDWYGSNILIEAVKLGVVNLCDALDRISPIFYGQASLMLGKDKAGELSKRIDISIQSLLSLDEEFVVPDIEMNINSEESQELSRFSVKEKQADPENTREIFQQFNESIEDFEKRQNRAFDSFELFRKKLTSAKAMIILDRFRLKEFKAIVDTDGMLAKKWHRLFMALPESKLPIAYNLIILLAYSLIGKETNKAIDLFNRVQLISPIVHFTYGVSKIGMGTTAIWSGTDCSELDTLRFQRLESIRNDHDLALEVLSAGINDKQGLLERYIDEKLSKEEPSEIARGIMVAGFSDSSSFNDDVLNRYKGSKGFLENVYNAAHYAYERNQWARHWYSKMCATDDPGEFWRFSLLLMKVVDGRFEVWKRLVGAESKNIKLFGPSLNQKLRHRIEKWDKKRKDKLFGQDVPSAVFLK